MTGWRMVKTMAALWGAIAAVQLGDSAFANDVLRPPEQGIAQLCKGAYSGGQLRTLAMRKLRQIPRPRLTSQLRNLVKHSKPGTGTYVSAAYVLARNGCDVWANAKAMASTYLLAGPYAGDPEDLLIHLPDRLAEVYRRHSNRRILLLLFDLHGDGDFAEAIADARARLFYSNPTATLRAAGSAPVRLDRLVADLSLEDSDPQMNKRTTATLLHLRKTSSPKLRSLAARCQQRLRKSSN